MKSSQARKLIGNVMGWSDEEATREFQWLDLMAQYKFDHYQGYGPGRRFFLTLLRWLTQFGPQDRRTAYGLLRDRLVFVSQTEMHHLVGRSGPIIWREMRRHVATLCGVAVHEVDLDAAAQRRMQLLQERTLYVGVSDGARIDVFRRFNEGTINNEQVVQTGEFSDRKWEDLHAHLKKRLDARGFVTEAAQFEWVCLIDDFSASATSSLSYDDEKREWKGKVIRFLNGPPKTSQQALLDDSVIEIHHYLGTEVARQRLTDACPSLTSAYPNLKPLVTFAHVLPVSVMLQNSGDPGLLELLNRHFDESCGDDIVGYQIALGYKNGGLPLVLDHNTPNNSVALLWASSRKDSTSQTPVSPLFPRRKRHMEIR